MARDLADELLQAKVKTRLFGGDRTVRLGRLVIVERLGSGAMGTVFAAYDPRLDRNVAVKVLHAGDEDANARALGEARALAKLAHPNVIAIHEAAEEDGCVYIVMELASGTPLRVWMTRARSWREVVRVMRDAAHGLAAAHRAGIVHRDIKPDNIVVGDTTRVIDFGLAQLATDIGHEMAGTPRYMAPETLSDEPATAASDQYSFGITLRDALPAQAPRWVHAIASRATAIAPAGRYPSMDAVATALARDRRRAGGFAIAAAALVAGGIAGALAIRAQSTHSCEPARTAWDPARADRIRGSLGDVPWRPATMTALAAHARGWSATYTGVCEATRVRGEQSDRLLELRMRCLDRARDRFDALAAALEGPLDDAARAEAAGAIAQLPSPDACRTITDDAELALPGDRRRRERVLAAERVLDRAWTDYGLGRYAVARAALAKLAAIDADAPGFAAARSTLAAAVESRIGEPAAARAQLDRALAATASAHAFALEYNVWTRLLRHELFAGTPARAIEWAPFARAAAVRASLDGGELDGILGEALRDAGDLPRARTHLERALASRDPLRDDQRAIIHMNLGSLELAANAPDRAEVAFQRALALARGILGDQHPSLALYRDKLAEADRARGRLDSALAHHDASIALRTRAYGEADRAVATARFHRAETLLVAHRLDDARADVTAARAIRVRIYGETSARLGELDMLLGNIARARGDAAAARDFHARAIALDPRLR